MKPKHLIIVSLVLVLLLAGCVTSGPVKNERVLIKLTDKIFMEEHNLSVRSYHTPDMIENIQYQIAYKRIFNINGVQNVAVVPYQIAVTKSPLFKWETIEPEILRILKQ